LGIIILPKQHLQTFIYYFWRTTFTLTRFIIKTLIPQIDLANPNALDPRYFRLSDISLLVFLYIIGWIPRNSHYLAHDRLSWILITFANCEYIFPLFTVLLLWGDSCTYILIKFQFLILNAILMCVCFMIIGVSMTCQNH